MPKKTRPSPFLEAFHCASHGIIGHQILKLGVYIDGIYITKTFCGLCHFDMLNKYCSEVVKVHGVIKKNGDENDDKEM